MDFMGLPVFTALKNKMQWHQVRQGVLSQNIANASTPGYIANDMSAPGSGGLKPIKMAAPASFASMVTDPKHIAVENIMPGILTDQAKKSDAFEITPDGNSVVLEEQMMKLAGNQMDYQAATSLYSSQLGLLRTAMGRSQ